MRTIVLQSYRTTNIPFWISCCLASVKEWSRANGFAYECHGDEVFELCGSEYLASVGGNIRSITNLARLELTRAAHGRGYDRAIWLDADVIVFDQERFRISLAERYAFARETWVARRDQRISIEHGVNNCAFVFMRDEPDLDLLINLTRHIARHRKITSNYQVGGDIVKGLRNSLAFSTLEHVGMFSPCLITGIARGDTELLSVQAREFGQPVFAANLAVTPGNHAPVSDADLCSAMNLLLSTRGGVINDYLSPKAPPGKAGMSARVKKLFSRFSKKRRIAG